jgi:hypothetical protein
MYVIKVIVCLAENLRDYALINRVSSLSGKPFCKVFLLCWRVYLITLSNQESIGISKSSTTLLFLYCYSGYSYNNTTIRISR